MITPKQVDTLKKMFAILKDVPQVSYERDQDKTYDEPVLMIDKGAFWIRETEIDQPSIRGNVKVPGFVLEAATYRGATRWEPEEYDYAEIYANQNFYDVAKEAVKAYVDRHCGCILDNLAYEGQYEEYQQELKEIAQAERQGQIDYEAGQNTNPYPYGIAHYYAWSKGWDAREYEVTLAMEEQG